MPLEIQTIYNAAYSNCIYKDKLDSYKNSIELENKDSLFTYEDTAYGGTAYRDNGCKYLFYWLYTYELNNYNKSIENTLKIYKDLYGRYNQNHDNLNTFDKYINEMNEQTSDKLVRLTNLYNELDNFFTENKENKREEACSSYSLKTYFSYVDECRKGYDNDFCNELKNFRKKYNSFIKNVIKCDEKYLLQPVESIDVVDMTVIPFSLISITSIIMPILYKFTAFGPWIRRLIGKKENTFEYINEETHHSLNTYEIGNENSNMRNYNIVYNSS
ncbi:PIR Superfamily Protein [Plasmodium ovale curtisi]|uniref:PIR Superfamily Protein n=1 Tax=Plasmodium ovale curtisi TaxID=864141 RepID=A0A1A8WV88_PLAOA|nr:PIR Superfamily Protein [Plasmodium ovale curtisi]SBT01798.1 PIR Superfamily Protein [Plasmodium ovale curtisi]